MSVVVSGAPLRAQRRNSFTVLQSIAVISISLFLGACSVTSTYSLAEYNQLQEAPMPPLSVFSLQPSEDFHQACQSFHQKSLLAHCQLNQNDLRLVTQELSNSQRFQYVNFANKDSSDDRRLLSAATYNLQDAEEFGKAVVTGATLMLAHNTKVPDESLFTAKVRNNWRDKRPLQSQESP